MNRIHKLSPVLSNQIAAGEVVERPASVAKELVENSIDAHSHEIDVSVKGSGLDQIKVVDDGSGIDHSDVELAFQRHATSKINNRRDLFQVSSLGFRGEALPSIASVADVILKTSTGGVGTQIHISGGKLVGMKPAESRRGTVVSVNNLFFDTPARLKYMKSPATELAKIVSVIDQLALGHPKIAFSLVHNGREILRTSGRGNLQQVVGSIYGINKVKKMLPIANSNLDFKIQGYVSLPELTRSSRNYISIIINGRYVKNLAIAKAVIKGYGSKLMVGRYPIAVINIQTDPLLVDPNVHPSKQVVRISKENSLCALIIKAIMKKLSHRDLIPDVMHRERSVKPKYNLKQLNMDLDKVSSRYQNIQSKASGRSSVSSFYNGSAGRGRSQGTFSDSQPIRPRSEISGTDTMVRGHYRYFPKLRYLGQVHGTYLLAESKDGLYILDQHAAQERINYEYYRKKIGQVSKDEQDLLVPIVLSYPTPDILKIKSHLNVLNQVGVYLHSFGKNSLIIYQHPTWFKSGQEKATLKEMIDWVLKKGRISVTEFRAKTAIMMSCKRAIKANHYLTRHQAIILIKRLEKTEDPFNCPHGRPVLVHFSNYDLEKMFKRVQDPHRSSLWKRG